MLNLASYANSAVLPVLVGLLILLVTAFQMHSGFSGKVEALPLGGKVMLHPAYSIFIGGTAAVNVLLGFLIASVFQDFIWGGAQVFNAGVLLYMTVKAQELLERAF